MKKPYRTSTKKAYIIAKRLKLLRNKNNISLEKLAETTGISKETLINYEKSDIYNTNRGMSIDNLLTLADTYKVSADYILGNIKTETRNEKPSKVCEYTGLSEEIVETLHSWNIGKDDWYLYENYLNFLNTMLSAQSFYCGLVDDFERYLSSFEFCKLLELENTDIDFSNTTPTLLIFNEENEENKKKRIRQEEINKIKEEYSKEIKDIQPINLFKIQKRFISFIENYATAEKDSITSIDEIIQKWNKKREYDEKWSGLFESIKNTLKEYKEKRKGGEK